MTSPGTTDVSLKSKLKQVLKRKEFSTDIDSTLHFRFSLTLTAQLRALQQSQSEAVRLEGSSLFACKINRDVEEEFLQLYGKFQTLYIRDGYDELYEDINRLWKKPTTKEVILNGNAGSGKSWYQLYVIRRLLRRGDYGNDGDDYDFIFRQVGTTMYLIDLQACIGYEVSSWHRETMAQLKRCLLFYEPGTEKELVPQHYGMPSLLTLSPYKKRIAEYKKGPSVQLYFWPWSFTELKAMIDHTNEQKTPEETIDFDEFFENYYLFGGIVRQHLLTSMQKRTAKAELDGRLLHMNLKVLQSKAVNIDRDANNDNVSDYILSFDGKREALEARRNDPERTMEGYFDLVVLRYTSAYVEEKAEELLAKTPLEDKMQVVLDRLNDRAVDLSGKNLEAVATEFLSAGQAIRWKVTRAGSGVWTEFKTTKRDVRKQYDISELATKVGMLLVSTNTSFPVADMVFSGWKESNNVYVFQCTWQTSHPFTVRALYDLRVKHLQIDAAKTLVIIMIVPGQEKKYSEKPEDDFLEGPLDEPLQYKFSETVEAEVLQEMWSNTQVFILQPNSDWKELISDWLLLSSGPNKRTCLLKES